MQTTNVINTVNDIINIGRDREIIHQYTEDYSYNGREITIRGKKVINFGSCSYLGLELDNKLKKAAIDAIERYGVQFSSSRTYLSTTLYTEWESLISKIFDNKPIVLSTSVSLGHHAVIPVLVEPGDAIIMDQQVHSSVQDAVSKMPTKGVTVKVVRHNNLHELEEVVKELSQSHTKVWYMIDGVYSMFGDFAPMQEILALLDKYKAMYLYADDAHGMSIAGKNGAGIAMSLIDEFHPKMVLATSLNKAFAAGGGAFIFPNAEMQRKVKNCGGSFIFSGAHQIPVIGAGIASAKVHLSDEIYELQAQLKSKLHYCHQKLKEYNLPIISNPDSPIFFIALGLTRVGYNLVERLYNDGCFVNLGIFPAVPETCTGVRFTITNHIKFEDIDHLVERLAYHFPRALADEGRTAKDITRNFRRVADFSDIDLEAATKLEQVKKSAGFTITHETTIKNIDKELWNGIMESISANNWDELAFFEDTFTGNELPEHEWKFHYYLVNDEKGKPVIATFFSETLTKDDMFAPAAVSKQLEYMRQQKGDKYYLSSPTMTMGNLLSVGQHIWIDKQNSEWRKALMLLLDKVWEEEDKSGTAILSLRDFDLSDIDMRNFFLDQGFIRIEIPDGHMVDTSSWKTEEEYLQSLKSDKRYFVRKRAMENEHKFDVSIVNKVTDEELDHYYSLYAGVSSKNYEIVGFNLHKKFFKNAIEHPNWELLAITLKPEFDTREEPKAVGFALSYVRKDKYCFLVTGIDYNYLEEFAIYPQIIWQTVKRSNELGLKEVNLGITASQSKRKFGAVVNKNVVYVQQKDDFKSAVIELIANQEIEHSISIPHK